MRKLILLFSAMLLVLTLIAQEPLNPDTTIVYRIETRDGNVFTDYSAIGKKQVSGSWQMIYFRTPRQIC